MRALFFLILLASLLPALLAFVARVPASSRPEYGILLARDTPSNETQEDSRNATASNSTSNSTSSSNSTSTDSNTNKTTDGNSTNTVPTLNTETSDGEDGGNATAPGELPLKPAVTPALGVGGFILLATGAVLALIGVRNLWVQVFLSCAFLTSLGVTVLIVYVMNTPVPNAIQGAYLVAIFFTGVIFGGLAIVFKELAEGLGCLLGGFCTSMWLLSTRDGGLLTGQDARTGFIGAISVGFYAVSFSHYTRPYGLIGSTSIAGGTAVALGIDCYSKAGWKEFWLYLWSLNDDIFPLGTNTYPVTRYIKVELAATVIIAVMGVISQLRLWKVVRERRAKDEENRQEEQKQKDEAEAEVAKRLAEHNLKERMEWEAKYGDQGMTESSSTIPELAAGRSHADEKDVKERDFVEESVSESAVSFRCSDCRARGDDGVSHTTVSEDGERQETEAEAGDGEAAEDTETPEEKLSKALGVITDDKASDMTATVGSERGETASVYSKRHSMVSRKKSTRTAQRPVSGAPEALVTRDDSSSVVVMQDDVGSDRHTIAADSEYQAMVDEERPVTAKKEDAISLKGEETSGGDLPSKSAEAQGPQPVEDDQHRDVVDEAASEITSKPKSESQKASTTGTVQHDVESRTFVESQAESKCAEVLDTDKVPKDVEQTDTPTTDGQPAQQGEDSQSGEADNSGDKSSRIAGSDKGKSRGDPTEGDNNSVPLDPKQPPSSEKASTKAKEPKKEVPKRLDSRTVDQIPKHTSRVVQAYRMSEWARHLSTADIPEPEPIQPLEDQPDTEPAEKEEAAAPVNVPELLQTPLNAQPPPAVESRHSFGRDTSANEQGSGSRTGSQKKKRRSGSPKRLSGQSVGSAHFAQGLPPAVQPQSQAQPGTIATSTSTPNLLDSAQEEKSKPRWKGPAPLIALREDMVRSRLSSVSLPTDAHVRHSTGQSPTEFPRFPSSTFAIPEEDDDDIPLSRRRSMLHQQATSPSPTPGPASTPSPPPAAAAAPARWNNPGVPSRANSPAVLAAWRESVREDLEERRDPLKLHPTGPGSPSPTGGDRGALPSPSPFNQMGQRNSSVLSLGVNERIGERIAEGMQRGDMSDLHREALRRMQAKANQSVNRLV